jgi:hypothetical protein
MLLRPSILDDPYAAIPQFREIITMKTQNDPQKDILQHGFNNSVLFTSEFFRSPALFTPVPSVIRSIRRVILGVSPRTRSPKARPMLTRYGNVGGASIVIELVNATIVFEHFMCLIELGF